MWNRFEVEAMRHDIDLIVTSSLGEEWRPFADLFD